MTSCNWALTHELNQHYHDTEWGVPCYDNQKLFEFILLEGAQAGLNWLTILKKRDNYREAFCEFKPEKIARFNQKKVDALLKNAGIIRNRLKIQSAIKNANAYLKLQETETFSDFLWDIIDGQPIINHWKTQEEVPAKTNISDQLSQRLKQKGFNFVGSTICYAFMQAMGMVNDHLVSCDRYRACMSSF